jgi:hypothetical protein
VTPRDFSDDPVLATLRVLGDGDVSTARAERLRTRCHAALAAERRRVEVEVRGSVWRRRVFPAVAGAWSAVYVFETLRRAVTFLAR